MNKEALYPCIPLAALFAALGLVLPILFHLTGLGSAFLPMFLPILMGSMLLPMQLAISIAVLTPVISFVFTGMPPVYPPVLPVMITELLIISTIASFLHFRRNLSVWLTLALALGTDRLFLLLVVYWIAPYMGLPGAFTSGAAVLHGIPGIVFMFIVIPFSLNILESKYPQIIERRIRSGK